MDDAYMFYAIAEAAIPMRGLKFEHVIEDIQALNHRAKSADLDMTAISAASYPALSGLYAILSVGSSVGRGYGPLLVAKEAIEPTQLKGKRVAVPGLQTTAALLLRLALPGIVPVEMPFTDTPKAVLDGQVAAGLVIHEWQLTYKDAGLTPIIDFGKWWEKETGLPIPLGLNCVKRSLGRELGASIGRVLLDSIVYANAHMDGAMEFAMRYGRGTDPARSKRFVGMYVNEDTLTFPQPCRQALQELYSRAKAAGIIPEIPPLDIIEPA